LTGGIGETTERLARRASRLHGLLGRLADITQRLAHRATGTERLLPKLADVSDSVVDRLDEALQDLRVPVERRQRPVEDVVEILEPDLQLGLALEPFDVDLDLAQVDVHARDHLQQVGELRTQRQMRLELLDVDVDLVHLDLADVDQTSGSWLGSRPSSRDESSWLALRAR
jgi:hypothetical protein